MRLWPFSKIFKTKRPGGDRRGPRTVLILKTEAGVTLMELLVAVGMFGVVGGTLAVAMSSTLRDLGRETRLASATQSVRMAVSVLTAELKMAAHASPYLAGLYTDSLNCTNSIQVTSNSIRFLIAEDNASANGGLRTRYVGYIYDPGERILYRGEVAGPADYSCTVPGSNPNDAFIRSPIAEKVIPVDYDGDGEVDPIFERERTNITVTLGIRVLSTGGEFTIQPLRSIVDMRNSNAIS